MPTVEGVAENWRISFSVCVFSLQVAYFWSIVYGSRAAAWPVVCLGMQVQVCKRAEESETPGRPHGATVPLGLFTHDDTRQSNWC